MKVLVTGGAGYIGSHTCIELIKCGYDVVVVDNLSNSKIEVINKIESITGKTIKFYKEDLIDKDALTRIFKENNFDAVIHFAGLKAVGESVLKPLSYYYNNIVSTLNLCDVLAANDCKNIVFSSSATVYGAPETVPIKEDFPLSATNPYGQTKLMIENILKDLFVSDNSWNITILRYFNPIGAHESGLLGDDPNGIPNNLMPYIAKVATSKLPHLNVFGNDYPTPDGTGVRDYIHVIDLANGHIKALTNMNGVKIYNLGTGIGYSVLDLVKSFEKVNNVEIPYKVTARRPGDIAQSYADPSKAQTELGWKSKYNIDDMCKSSYYFIMSTKGE